MPELTQFAHSILQNADAQARRTTTLLRRGIITGVLNGRAVVELAGGTVEDVAVLDGYLPVVGARWQLSPHQGQHR